MTDVVERGANAVDWTAIERSDTFRELVRSRRGFSSSRGDRVGTGLLYIVLIPGRS